jgi:ribose transport system ATP-binding protein
MEERSDHRSALNPTTTPPLLVAQGLCKSFPGVRALRQASLDLKAGEIHALVGENGAGKSTLIKILTGVHLPEAGSMVINGAPVNFRSPLESRRSGVTAIYQELSLVPSLSVRANLFLGRERARLGFINSKAERSASRDILERLGVAIDPDGIVSSLTVAQQQMVEIGRALAQQSLILILDEPTAALAPREVERLFGILRDLALKGLGIIFISHRLDEVFSIADRITVMRDGVVVATRRAQEFTRQHLIELMVGRTLSEEFPKVAATIHTEGLHVNGLSGGKVSNVSFVAHRGEILGLAGLMGAGRTEVARLIFGADQMESGVITLDGQSVKIGSPRDAIRSGICLLTEDRKNQGLVLKLSAQENFALGNLTKWSRGGWIDSRTERSRFQHHIEVLKLRITTPDQRAETLSGGNQQKLLIARWLEAKSQVVILDEPTRGIDVGAKHEMYLLINDLAAQGKVVILISSELPELLGMCDRIVVMRRGRISGEITNLRTATQDQIMALAV